ncbi:hypothetical protein HDU67_000083 [Dinochytrium kinnereticum]|nr:hypothetical protein HDU67_000083 [Dinochytrium kinnereticum]
MRPSQEWTVDGETCMVNNQMQAFPPYIQSEGQSPANAPESMEEQPLPRGYPFIAPTLNDGYGQSGSEQPITNVIRPVLPGIGKVEINGVVVKINTLAHISILAKQRSDLDNTSWVDTLSAQPLLVTIQVFTTLLAISFLAMTPFHVWLTMNNLTTHEHLKRKYYYDEPEVSSNGPRVRPHPFWKGSRLANASWVLCRPLESSLLLTYTPPSHSSEFLSAGSRVPPPPQLVFQIEEELMAGRTENVDAVTLHVAEEVSGDANGPKFIKSG